MTKIRTAEDAAAANGRTARGTRLAKPAVRKERPRAAAFETRIAAVLAGAERSGFLREKTERIGGRVSPILIERAKANTGISSDTELLEFALANVALEDNFAEAFNEVGGTVDPELKLGF